MRALAGVIAGDLHPDSVLQRACEAATLVLPGADSVSVTLLEPGAPRTTAAAGELARHVDQLQYGNGDGPCLEAARTAAAVLVLDLDAESRWPAYIAAARDTGLRSSLSVPLRASAGEPNEPRALNLYSTRAAVLGEDSVELALAFAEYAGTAAALAADWARSQQVADQLGQAMASRATIEQAKGIVMAQQNCGAAQAFEVLVRLSQTTHVKVRDIAEALVEQASGD